eukprot:365942-Chlamydomonas_euryale.AAC.8
MHLLNAAQLMRLSHVYVWLHGSTVEQLTFAGGLSVTARRLRSLQQDRELAALRAKITSRLAGLGCCGAAQDRSGFGGQLSPGEPPCLPMQVAAQAGKVALQVTAGPPDRSEWQAMQPDTELGTDLLEAMKVWVAKQLADAGRNVLAAVDARFPQQHKMLEAALCPLAPGLVVP